MYTGPNIVEENLIFYLDAANVKSYPGSGTSCTELSLNRSSGTLENGASLDSGDQGSFVFDGTDDRIAMTNNLMSSLGVSSGNDNDVPYSMEAVFKIHTNPSGVGTSGYSLIGHASSDGIGLQVFDNSGIYINFGYRGNSNYSFSQQVIAINTWYHVICTRPSGGSSVVIRCYINGSEIGSTTIDLRVDYTTAEFQVGDAESRIGNLDGNIALARVYNRALTASEVLQNYNATKGRFGI